MEGNAEDEPGNHGVEGEVMSKTVTGKTTTGYKTRGGDFIHAVLEGEETAVCGITVHNVSNPFDLYSFWSCRRCVKILSRYSDEQRKTLSIFDTDNASPVRFEFSDSDAETIFSIGPDGVVTVNPNIELDDAGRAFWKAVDRTAPSAHEKLLREFAQWIIDNCSDDSGFGYCRECDGDAHKGKHTADCIVTKALLEVKS